MATLIRYPLNFYLVLTFKRYVTKFHGVSTNNNTNIEYLLCYYWGWPPNVISCRVVNNIRGESNKSAPLWIFQFFHLKSHIALVNNHPSIVYCKFRAGCHLVDPWQLLTIKYYGLQKKTHPNQRYIWWIL